MSQYKIYEILTKLSFKGPIIDLDDVFPFEVLEAHINSLSNDEVVELFKDDLPPSIAENPTKSNILDLLRSGFFQQSKNNLSSHLKKSNGAGYLLSQSFGVDYVGEGITNFLNGIRKASKKPTKEGSTEEQP